MQKSSFFLSVLALFAFGCSDEITADDDDDNQGNVTRQDADLDPYHGQFGGNAGESGAGGQGGNAGTQGEAGNSGTGGQPSGGGSGDGGTGGGSSQLHPGDHPYTVQPWCDPTWSETCDNFDNDCDGQVDEGCGCTASEKPCYTGNPQEIDPNLVPNGQCKAGMQACIIGEYYGECMGQVLPTQEVCDGIDNDCDGIVDGTFNRALGQVVYLPGCQNQSPIAVCPSDQEGLALATYNLFGQGVDPDGDPNLTYSWSILEKPAGSTAEMMPPTNQSSSFFADLSGDYLIQLEVMDSQGGLGRCTTRIRTKPEDGLRVEMVWNVGTEDKYSDVDLHLKKTPTSKWFDNDDDCYYWNCKLCSVASEEECREEISAYNLDPTRRPQPVLIWSDDDNDDNDPRLDLDDQEGYGPENLSIYKPQNGTYRLGIHYYSEKSWKEEATVTVTIYCGGTTKVFPPTVLRKRPTTSDKKSSFWEVADITWSNNRCTIKELGTTACPRICNKETAENSGCPENQTYGEACNQ